MSYHEDRRTERYLRDADDLADKVGKVAGAVLVSAMLGGFGLFLLLLCWGVLFGH